MPITLIIGKPGSGKSYFAVRKLSEMVLDWADFEQREGKPFERVLYTNLKLNVDAFQDFLKNHGKKDFDFEKYYKYVDTDFFYMDSGGKRVPYHWWEDVPTGALLVIDEVHQYMPQDGTGSKDYMRDFVEYCSTHRHRQHDLILITQHTDNINRSILNMAGDVYHILNVKDRVIPFLKIPFADLDVIKEAWGVYQQMANVLYGNYVGRRMRIQSSTNIVLSPEIFALYETHAMGSASSGSPDRPSLKLGRVGSIWWFIKRHWFHLCFKAGMVYGAFWGIQWLFSEMPDAFTKAMVKQVNINSLKEEKKTEKSVTPSVPPLLSSQGRSSPVPIEKDVDVEKEKEKDFYNSTGIYIYGTDFIVTKKDGRVLIGEQFNWKGKNVVLDSVDYKNKKLFFSDVSRAVINRVPSDPSTELFRDRPDEISEVTGDGREVSTGRGDNIYDVR